MGFGKILKKLAKSQKTHKSIRNCYSKVKVKVKSIQTDLEIVTRVFDKISKKLTKSREIYESMGKSLPKISFTEF